MKSLTSAALVTIFLSLGACSKPPEKHSRRHPPQLSTVLISDETGHGSGVHIGNGYIVTAAHVADHEKQTIKDSAGRERPATLLWTNKAYDIALMHVDNYHGLSASPLDCYAKLPIGKALESIGNPFDMLFVHTWGRIASDTSERGPWKSSIVVDMTIAPGSSGGPLFDEIGDVVAIAVGVETVGNAFTSSIVGYTYAVPVSAICMLMGRAT